MLLNFCKFLHSIFVLHFPSLRPCILSTLSICLHFIRFDSFIQWNQTDPAVLSILTHSVPLVPSLQLIWLKPYIRQFPFLLIFIPSLISLHWLLSVPVLPTQQEQFTQLANICFVPFQCIVSFLENFLVQTAPLNLSVIPLLSSYLSIWLIPFSHNFHAIIPWIPSVPSITQFQFYQFQWL